MNSADWAGACTVLLGVLGQQLLHAPKTIDNRLAALIVFAAAFGLYALATPLTPDIRQWVMSGVLWSLSGAGAGHVLASFGAVSPTDSVAVIHTELPKP